MKIIVFCGGPSAEYEVSLSTARGIIDNLDPKHEVSVFLMGRNYKGILFKPNKEGIFPSPQNDFVEELQKIPKSAVIFNATHGEFGEDGVLQSLLDSLGYKYTGTGAKGSILCMNKFAAFSLVSNKLSVKIPSLYSIEKILSGKEKDFGFPLVLKPINMGSSVGVEIVHNKRQFSKVCDKLSEEFSGIDFMFEEYITDAIEISCGCLERKKGRFIKLPPVEIKPIKGEFYDYSSKYEDGGSEHSIPPKSIEKSLQDKISKLTCDIHKTLSCKTYSRSDFLVKNGDIYYLETNSLPGMTPTSLIPEEAKAIGMEYPEFVEFILENT